MLRILIFLAVNDGELTSAREIATRYNISAHHVSKAAKWLVRHGYVSATRGQGGGLKLAVAPRDIMIGRVIRPLIMFDLNAIPLTFVRYVLAI